MEKSTKSLETTLDLQQIASSDIFVGQPRPQSATGNKRTHLFGGLIAAQSVVAASRTVPKTHRIHSLHSYFILAGDGRMPILFQVTRIRDGGSFNTRQVLALQDNQPIFMMTASFHAQEPGPEFQRTPEELKNLLLALLPENEGRVRSPSQMLEDGRKVTPHSPHTGSLSLFAGLNHSLAWRRYMSEIEDEGQADAWVRHAALLAYMSDEGLLSTVRQPYKGTPIAMTTSLDHTIHFHRAFRADQWMLFHNETTVSSGGRGVARTEVWTEGGYLVASFLQEGLMRPPRHWKPEVNPADELDATAARTLDMLRMTAPPSAKL
eukprot:gnl/TRDRNA2_/TRDRNA2_31011_c0_seq1.p1 gnl/TRDRNA2_/TRDRNA2_31011_c0~~gnl/TRDRNA2_/TRDRNA2_31011_c0_seq1.p1  ORF type:complete len:321 (+),score=51.53 gnl/TRDRNA2_/TRDRNA2_31011_c0_seq1:80-1042(+)